MWERKRRGDAEETADRFDMARFTAKFSWLIKHLSWLSKWLVSEVDPHP